jgi:hypothetical protein
MDAETILNSYMVTNRYYPREQWSDSIYPLPATQNHYLWAPGANNSDDSKYQAFAGSPTSSMPQGYQNMLAADIRNAVRNGGEQVTLLIHGMGYYFSDACYLLGTAGKNIGLQGYKGLLVGFSWPSYGSAASVKWYGSLPYSFPPTAEYGTIRDNIQGSTRSLLYLFNQLVPLCKSFGARLNVICHSEGNYMLMLAMYALSRNSDPALDQLARGGPFMDQSLLVAADINDGVLVNPSQRYVGQGSPIAQYSKTVTVYWSTQDNALPISEGWTDYHNPLFPKRLGLRGPNNNTPGVMLPNAYGLDCSLVAYFSNPHIPWNVSVHGSYFYIPQILLDMKQTLGDTPPASVVNRAKTGNQSFQMTYVPSPLMIQPTGIRLEKKGVNP